MPPPPKDYLLREYYSRTNAQELNCPFYAHFRLYKRRELHRLFTGAMERLPANSSGTLRVLELGCGDGSDLDYILCRLTGFWKKPEAIAHMEFTFAEAKPPLAELVRARLADLAAILPGFRGTCQQLNIADPLPFSDKQFDIVICSEVLEHLESPEATLGEIHRILTINGCFIMTTDNEPTVFGAAKRTLARLLGRYQPGMAERYRETGEKTPDSHVEVNSRLLPVYGHINTRTTNEWEDACIRAGFTLRSYGRYDSVVRHFGDYSPFKFILFAFGNLVASTLPPILGRHLGATTVLLLQKAPHTERL